MVNRPFIVTIGAVKTNKQYVSGSYYSLSSFKILFVFSHQNKISFGIGIVVFFQANSYCCLRSRTTIIAIGSVSIACTSKRSEREEG